MLLGRNDPCWCGSGKKFKKCHLERDKSPMINRANLEAYAKKQSSKKSCCVPDSLRNECEKKIISAHTISKRGSLEKISEHGHVMGTKPSFGELEKNNGRLGLHKVGINNASTFSGFCSKHDREIFSPLENKPIDLSDEQLFLLAYRGMCREIFNKENNKNLAKFMREADAGQDQLIQFSIQNYANNYEEGVNLALRDLNKLKQSMDNILTLSSFHEMKHCIFEFSEPPKVLVSAMIIPEVDFCGNRLQQLGNTDIEYSYIIFNCISYDNKGCFVFSWLNDNDGYCKKLVESLLTYKESEMGDALVRFCYSFAENTWASPSWWESLDSEQQEFIKEMIHYGMPVIPQDCLARKELKFNALQVARVETRYS